MTASSTHAPSPAASAAPQCSHAGDAVSVSGALHAGHTSDVIDSGARAPVRRMSRSAVRGAV